jgi:cytochrome P450
VTTEASQLPEYPIVDNDDLSIDPAYRELQRAGPFKARMALGEPIWIATRYEDVKTVYGDRRFGKARGYGRDTPRLHGSSHGGDTTRLDNMDPPNHTRVRRLASVAFAPSRIREMAAWIEDLTAELLDEVADHGPGADLMEMFAWKLPLRVVSGILGAPEATIPTLRAWVDRISGADVPTPQRRAAYDAMKDHVRGLIAERRTTTTDDLLCQLVQARDDDDRLGEDELVNISMTLFLGGFETTAAQLGSVVWTLMAQRDRWQELLDDPELLPAAIEELWRWIPSFRHGRPMIRWADDDVELSGGVVIPAGDPVLPEHQLANRDDSVFPHADEVDFHRDAPPSHLALAWGSHRCMGAHLANLEVERTLRALLERFPTLDLAIAPEDVKWSRATFLRSAAELPIVW